MFMEIALFSSENTGIDTSSDRYLPALEFGGHALLPRKVPSKLQLLSNLLNDSVGTIECVLYLRSAEWR